MTHKLDPTVKPFVVDALPVMMMASLAALPKVTAPAVVTAPVSVLAPVTERVPSVVILVLIVVAAPTETAIKRVEKTSDNARERIMPLFLASKSRCIEY